MIKNGSESISSIEFIELVSRTETFGGNSDLEEFKQD